MARTRRRYSRSKPKRKKQKSTKLKRSKNITKRKRRRSRKSKNQKKSRLAGEYSSDYESSSSKPWSKASNEFALESWGTGEGISGPLLGRNPSGTRRNIEEYEDQLRREEERIKLDEEARIARIKAQKQTERAALIKKNLGRFNKLMEGTSFKDLRKHEKAEEDKKKKKKELEAEEARELEYLISNLKGRVRSHWNLGTMSLSELRKLRDKADEAEYYHYYDV